MNLFSHWASDSIPVDGGGQAQDVLTNELLLELIRNLVVEPADASDHGPCACCGHTSRTAWGFVHWEEGTLAAYFAHWIVGQPRHGVHLDMIVGRWGETSSAADREAVSLACRFVNNRPELSLIDAPGRQFAQNELVGRALRREEVLGRPLATKVFALADAILFHDGRLADLTGRASMALH
ncbi:MAG: hypothetical protein U0Q16_28230 [Bryobacteraceae bacterium]